MCVCVCMCARVRRVSTHIVLTAQLSHSGQVPWIWNQHPSLSLDGLHHEGCHVLVLQGPLWNTTGPSAAAPPRPHSPELRHARLGKKKPETDRGGQLRLRLYPAKEENPFILLF